MKSWLGLVLSPSIALAAQSAMFSMVTPACGKQTPAGLHLAAGAALVLVLLFMFSALGESSLRHRGPASADSDEAQAPAPRRFLADVATAVSALSALVILGMWFALWVLSPCGP